jgi:tetratricopeptide (TPR) repeat protein
VTPQDRIDIAVPMTEEHFNRRRRRIVFLCSGTAVILAFLTYVAYRHFMDPINARDAYNDAKRLLVVTRYSQSILSASRAIDLKPDYADAWFLRAQTYAAQRELDPAESDYTHLIQIEPNAARGYAGRCAVRFDYKDYKSTITDCSKAIEFDKTNARTFNLRGAALRATGDLQGSLADLNKAVELDPDVGNLYQRGATYRALGEFKKAIADFDQAAYLFPGNPEVYRARAETKRAMGDEKGAVADYDISKAIETR